MRLTERKLKLVERVCKDAEMETVACQREMGRLTAILEEDDDLLELEDEERAQMDQKIKTLELQFARWCKIFTTRQQEMTDVRAGLKRMQHLSYRKKEEKKEVKALLKQLRDDIPKAAFALHGTKASLDVAHAIGPKKRPHLPVAITICSKHCRTALLPTHLLSVCGAKRIAAMCL